MEHSLRLDQGIGVADGLAWGLYKDTISANGYAAELGCGESAKCDPSPGLGSHFPGDMKFQHSETSDFRILCSDFFASEKAAHCEESAA